MNISLLQGKGETSKKVDYPNSFLFGVVSGIMVNAMSRMSSYEPLAARPWSYMSTGLALGFAFWYYDYWRRRAMDEVMVAEQRRNYHQMLRGLNRIRVGEEEEITNLIDYLQNTSVRE